MNSDIYTDADESASHKKEKINQHHHKPCSEHDAIIADKQITRSFIHQNSITVNSKKIDYQLIC